MRLRLLFLGVLRAISLTCWTVVLTCGRLISSLSNSMPRFRHRVLTRFHSMLSVTPTLTTHQRNVLPGNSEAEIALVLRVIVGNLTAIT